VLLKIPHVGETRVKALLRQFDTIGDIAEASFDDIVSVPGLDVRSASAIVEYFETER